MENFLAMSGSREISKAALQEMVCAAVSLSADDSTLPARRRQHPSTPARPCRGLAGGELLEMKREDSLQPAPDPSQEENSPPAREDRLASKDTNQVTPRRGKLPSWGGAVRGFTSGQLAIGFIAGLLLLGIITAQGEETNKNQHAKLKISGFGLLGNRELKKTIRLMSGNKSPPEFYESNFV